MADPVTTADGHTYECDNIVRWLLEQGKDVSPVTNLRLANKTLTPVFVVRNQIRAFVERNPCWWTRTLCTCHRPPLWGSTLVSSSNNPRVA
jgi:hypothetical protein